VLVLAVAVGAACLTLGTMIGAAVAGLDKTAGTRPRAAATTRPPATAAAEEPATTEPAPAYPEPKPSDFDLKVKILKKENFGSAGSPRHLPHRRRLVQDLRPRRDLRGDLRGPRA
jgi:hypothetical protein